MMKYTLLAQSHSQTLLITFSNQYLRLSSQKSNFQTNSFECFYQQKQWERVITATYNKEIYKIISSLNNNKSCEPNSN